MRSVASGGAVIGSHHLKLTLKPGESKSLIFVLGYSENDPEDTGSKTDLEPEVRTEAEKCRLIIKEI